MAVIMSEILETGSQLAFAAFAGKQHSAADRKPGEAVLAGKQHLAADRKPGEAVLAGKQHLAADRKPGETVLAGNFSAPGYPPAVLLMRFSTQKPIKNAILVLLKRFQKIRTRKLV